MYYVCVLLFVEGLCNLAVLHLNLFYILFSCSLLTFSVLSVFSLSELFFHYTFFPFLQKSVSMYPDFSVSLKIFHIPTSFTLLSLLIYFHLSPCVQWRASGWSGGHGRDAVWLVTQEPSRGRDAAVRQRMVGLNVRAPIRRAENAPTLHAVVRHTT